VTSIDRCYVAYSPPESYCRTVATVRMLLYAIGLAQPLTVRRDNITLRSSRREIIRISVTPLYCRDRRVIHRPAGTREGTEPHSIHTQPKVKVQKPARMNQWVNQWWSSGAASFCALTSLLPVIVAGGKSAWPCSHGKNSDFTPCAKKSVPRAVASGDTLATARGTDPGAYLHRSKIFSFREPFSFGFLHERLGRKPKATKK
jgi:hypothetical protein